MKSELVSHIFRDIGQLLEIQGENLFRIRAYERAAQVAEDAGDEIEQRAAQGTLQELPGIGKDLAGKIKEILDTGECAYYHELKKKIPRGLLEILEVPGLGPKTVRLFYERLGIDTLKKLEHAARSGKLRTLEGVKEKTEENVLKGIALMKKGRERTPLPYALEEASRFVGELKKNKAVKKIEIAGSLRRRRDTVKDIDILVVSDKPAAVMDAFTSLPYVKEVVVRGETKSSVLSDFHGMQVDVRVVKDREFGSALLYFTGSKQFNIVLRQMAVKKGLKISEYGVFAAGKGKEVWKAGKTEKEIFRLLGMEYVPPELREDRGEIDAALAHEIPDLVTIDDIKGEFHVHSTYSDGHATIEESVLYARSKGYNYIGIADHSPSLRVAGGLDKDAVYRKIEEIRRLSRKYKGIKILCATEVDILSDGTLDYPDDILKEFDIVIAAIHTGFKQSRARMTGRLVRACTSKRVNIIAHPSGRLYGARDEYEFSFEELVKAAADHNVALEVNCHPQRMDLNDVRCMQAARAHVKCALGTDAHRREDMDFMEMGVSIARRGWLTKGDVLNCGTIGDILKWARK